MRHLALRTLNPTHGLPCCCLQDTGVLSGSKVSLLRPPQSPSRAVGVPAWPRGCGVPRRGPSGAPVWSLRPDAASQRICAAGLSSRHVNQHSHKLCSLPSLGDCWMPPPSTVHQPRQRPRLGLQPRLPSQTITGGGGGHEAPWIISLSHRAAQPVLASPWLRCAGPLHCPCLLRPAQSCLHSAHVLHSTCPPPPPQRLSPLPQPQL